MNYDRALYRPCVGAMMVNRAGRAFVGKRIDNQDGNWWQMPQGGVDDGEDLRGALLRELGEETGVRAADVEILADLGRELFYDLPSDLKGTLWGGRFVGQRQSWYLVRFTGLDSDIDIWAHDPPEFHKWKWVDPERLPDLIVPFKRTVYRTIVDGFRGMF